MRWFLWFCIKCGITVGCLISLQAILADEGYHLRWQNLIIGGVIFIVGIKLWSFNYKKDDI